MMEIPFHKPYITNEEINEVVDSLRSGWITTGPKVIRFEKEFSQYIGSVNAVALNSCTAALHLALEAIELTRGDEVIVPTMTFVATSEVVCYFDAKPVLVDVRKDTHNMNAAEIEKHITSRTRAIIPVHFAGQPCDMDEIMRIARKHKLFVIEDAAHALPALYKDKKIGAVGDMTCFSFYATKTLATGEGGMVTTNNEGWADKIKVLRLHGIPQDAWKRYSHGGSWYYEVVERGYKYNMTDIQASLGVAQLRKVELMLQKRNAIAERYTKAFRNSDYIIPPHVESDRVTSWHLYVIKLNLEALRTDRARFIEELRMRGISASVHFIPLHRHPFYRDSFGYKPEDFPDAEWVYGRSISLPIYPSLDEKETDYVINNVLNLCKKWAK